MLSQSEIRERERALFRNGQRLFRPLAEIANDELPPNGILTGLPVVDNLTGGLYPNRLNMFVGYTNHGKTAGMLTVIANNLIGGKHVLFASCDDTDDDVLRKLLAMRNGVSTQRVMENGAQWRSQQAAELDGQLMIASPLSGTFTVDDLAVLFETYKEQKGQYPDLFFFDYLTLLSLPGRDEPYSAVRKQALGFKELIRGFKKIVYVIGHQCNRSTVTGFIRGLETKHVEAGGVQETNGVMIGFRRRIDTEELTEDERAGEAEYPTVNVSVMKNKVTGRRSPDIAGHRYAIDPVSGLIRERSVAEIRHKPATLKEIVYSRGVIDKYYADDDAANG